MVYLFLAVLCSSSIALIFKVSEGNKMNRYVVTSVNYFTASFVSLLMIISNSKTKLPTVNIAINNFKTEFNTVIFSNNTLFTDESSFVWACLLGLISGAFFFLSFLYYQKSVNENGAALSGTFGKLGILIPMMFSIVFWNEIPTVIQWLGIALALFSIIYVNISSDDEKNKKINFTILLLFIFGGMAEFQNKLFQRYALTLYKDVFLFLTFSTAFIWSLCFVIKSKGKLNKYELLTGFLVGIPNLFSSYFLIMALNTIKTSLAFPIYSAGSIVCISIGEMLLFKEKFSRKNKIAIIIVGIALIFINV